MSNHLSKGQKLTVMHADREVAAEVLEVGATTIKVRLPNGDVVTKDLMDVTRTTPSRETAAEVIMERERGS